MTQTGRLAIEVLRDICNIYRFDPATPIPDWMDLKGFHSITRTPDEISVVAGQIPDIPADTRVSKGWRVLKIIGPLDFSLVGIIADLSAILRKEQVPIFTISTFDTDYILVKEKDLDRAIAALVQDDRYTIR